MTQKTNTAEAEQSAKSETPANGNAVPPKKKRDFSLFKSHFTTAGRFAKEDKGVQSSAIVMGILLGTTALATPLLGSALGAAGAMAVGMYLLMKTSDTVVNNMAVLGKKMGIAPMTLGIGLGLLTSLPELLVSGGAIMQGNPAIGIGNIAGSNIANILLILGATAAIRKIEGKGNSWKFNAAVMGVSTAAFATQMALGALNPIVGAAMLGGLGLYMWQSYKRGQKDMPTAEEQQAAADAKTQAVQNGESVAEEPKEAKLPTWMNISLGLAGVAGLVGAASFLVASATAFGIAAGVSPALVGVLGVAIGTSLPELTVNIKAALKGETDMAIGNVLGSNVFNLLMIGGIVSLTGAEIPPDLNPRETLMGFVNTAAFGVSALLAWGAMKLNNGGITRKQGVAGVALYAAYTTATVMLGTADPSAVAGAATATAVPPPPPPPPPAGP